MTASGYDKYTLHSLCIHVALEQGMVRAASVCIMELNKKLECMLCIQHACYLLAGMDTAALVKEGKKMQMMQSCQKYKLTRFIFLTVAFGLRSLVMAPW